LEKGMTPLITTPSFSFARNRLKVGVFLCVGLCLATWLGGCSSTKDTTHSKLPSADEVVVDKSDRKLRLMKDGKVMREYRVALGKDPIGHKFREGDQRTPEGKYVLDWRNQRSQFYKSIHVSYPNAEDRFRAQEAGYQPGGMIMIHGRPNYIKSATVQSEYDRLDWTNGCIAVKNHEMDEIWQAVQDGTPIHIQP
jgi:murein L,D-transpeptidase YafK